MTEEARPAAEVNHDTALDAARGRGDHRFDPVRFRFIEALARRAHGSRGAAREWLDSRVASLLEAHCSQAEKARAGPGAPLPRRQEKQGAPGPIGELLAHLAEHDGSHAGGALGELKTLRLFRGTWSRLHANQRLTQSLAKVPDQAGPLNSQHLVHRTLTLLRDLSPAYLDRFMAYVDALSWLEQVQTAAAPAPKESPRTERRSPRGKQA